MNESRNVEDVVQVVVPRLQNAVASEIRNLAQELAARADEVRAEAEAEHEASLARERSQALAERSEAISAAADAAREQAAVGVASRLLEAVRRMDSETTLGGVLDALAELAGAEAGRAALFVAAEGGLRSWRLAGFDPAAGGAGRVLTATESGVVARALDERRSVPVARARRRVRRTSPRLLRPCPKTVPASPFPCRSEASRWWPSTPTRGWGSALRGATAGSRSSRSWRGTRERAWRRCPPREPPLSRALPLPRRRARTSRLAVRGETPRSTESGEAPAWQGSDEGRL